MEAHRLRYMQDMSNREIARNIGVTESTVENYFSNSDNDKFKRFYSDQQLFKLQQSLERDIWDGEQEAKELLSDASDLVESPKEMRQLADQVMRMRKQKVKLLQQLGIIDKPKERKEVEQTGGGESVSFEMRYTSSEKEEKREAEA